MLAIEVELVTGRYAATAHDDVGGPSGRRIPPAFSPRSWRRCTTSNRATPPNVRPSSGWNSSLLQGSTWT